MLFRSSTSSSRSSGSSRRSSTIPPPQYRHSTAPRSPHAICCPLSRVRFGASSRHAVDTLAYLCDTRSRLHPVFSRLPLLQLPISTSSVGLECYVWVHLNILQIKDIIVQIIPRCLFNMSAPSLDYFPSNHQLYARCCRPSHFKARPPTCIVTAC